jgi:hypothetical protein
MLSFVQCCACITVVRSTMSGILTSMWAIWSSRGAGCFRRKVCTEVLHPGGVLRILLDRIIPWKKKFLQFIPFTFMLKCLCSAREVSGHVYVCQGYNYCLCRESPKVTYSLVSITKVTYSLVSITKVTYRLVSITKVTYSLVSIVVMKTLHNMIIIRHNLSYVQVICQKYSEM